MSKPLLAKSSSISANEATLLGHTSCVLGAVDALFGREDKPTHLAERWLRFFGFNLEDFTRFRHHVRVAASVHDWGKANRGFQDLVEKQGTQEIRHEHLSGLLLASLTAEPWYLKWLKEADVEEMVVLAAVLGHHVKVGTKGDRALGFFLNDASSVQVLSDHEDFGMIWQWFQDEVGKHLGKPCPGSPSFPGRMTKDDLRKRSLSLMDRFDDERSRLNKAPDASGNGSWPCERP